MNRININKYIVADSNICHGKPTFKETRIMVWQVLEMLQAGLSKEQIIEAFPALTNKHIKAALSYVAGLLKGENHVLLKV